MKLVGCAYAWVASGLRGSFRCMSGEFTFSDYCESPFLIVKLITGANQCWIHRFRWTTAHEDRCFCFAWSYILVEEHKIYV